MRNYELTYLSSEDISEKVKNLIKEEGAVLEKTMKGDSFTSLEFSLSPEKLKNLEKKLKAEKEISRYMIVFKKKIKQAIKKVKISQPLKKQKVELKEIDKKIEEMLKE